MAGESEAQWRKRNELSGEVVSGSTALGSEMLPLEHRQSLPFSHNL